MWLPVHSSRLFSGFELLKLLPRERAIGSVREIKLGHSKFAINIDDIAKYTLDISIKQLSGMVSDISPLYLTVRLYNDAKVAEIVHHDYHQRIKPSYGYPNPKMHQKDEKYQLNAFLYDWLVACVERGQSSDPRLLVYGHLYLERCALCRCP